MVEKHIFRKEEKLARECLGWDFYELLLADLIDWSGVKAWIPGTAYVQGDLVNYYGLVISSKVDANTNEPCEDTDGQYWELAKKFTNACYQKLWEFYLREYLANVVMASSVEHTTYPASAKGIQEWMQEGNNSGAKSASHQVFVARKNKLLGDASEALDNMKAWILREHKDVDSSCDFSKVAFVESCIGTCDTPGQVRRFYFRRNITKY